MLRSRTSNITQHMEGRVVLTIHFRSLTILILIHRSMVTRDNANGAMIRINNRSIHSATTRTRFRTVTIHLSSINSRTSTTILNGTNRLRITSIRMRRNRFHARPTPSRFTTSTYFMIPTIFQFVKDSIFRFTQLFNFIKYRLQRRIMFNLNLSRVTRRLRIVASYLMSFNSQSVHRYFKYTLMARQGFQRCLRRVL